MEADVEKIGREISKLEEREKVLKRALEEVESSQAGDIERKKNSVLFERIVDMQAAIKTLRQQRGTLEGNVADLSSILGDLSVSPRIPTRFRSETDPFCEQRDFNPNYQDMAVLGASRAYKDWQRLNGHAEDDADASETPIEGESAESAAVVDSSAGDDVQDFTDRELQALEDEDPLSLIDSISSRVGSPAGQTSTRQCRYLFCV